MPVEIITTSDGSHSLRNSDLDETYHSIHGAVQESLHVFIASGLDFFIEQNPKADVSILEIGFGTGLNALLTWQRALSLENNIQYTTLETYPITFDTWSELNYANTPEDQVGFKKLHEAEWNQEVSIETNFKLKKISEQLQTVEFPLATFDLVYFDAFAPNKQPEMWTLDVLTRVVSWMKSGAVFVTYCAKGQLKRDLKALGLEISTLSGPPGKKEMVRAKK